MAARKSTGKRQRFNIFKRDRFTCQYCGQTPPNVVLVVDHILPVSAGGGNEETNLITACETCNQGKSDGLLSSVPKPLVENLRDQVERREQLEEYNTWLLKARKRRQESIRELGVYWCDLTHPDEQAGQWIVSQARLVSLQRFAEKLPTAKMLEAMDIAIGRVKWTQHDDENAWKYFCGICWSTIREDGKDA